jgi:hypothetical protein
VLIYFFVLLVPLVAGLLHPLHPQRNYPGLWVFFVVLLIFCGLRVEVGPDWWSYENLFDVGLSLDYEEVFESTEPSFYLLSKFFDWLGLGFAGVIFACSLIFLYGCFSYARKTANPWLAVAAVMPYLIFIISTSGIRQACAIGIGFYILANWDRFSTVRKILLVCLAASFHNSAAVLLLFLIYRMRSGWPLRACLAVGVALIITLGLNTTESFEKYQAVYVEQNLVSEGAFFHVLLIAFPAALYLYFRKQLAKIGASDPNVFLASALTLALMFLLPLSSTGIDRLTLYFSFVQMWTYPALLRSGIASRPMIKTGLVGIVLTIFLVYFIFGGHVSAYVPYKTILLD